MEPGVFVVYSWRCLSSPSPAQPDQRPHKSRRLHADHPHAHRFPPFMLAAKDHQPCRRQRNAQRKQKKLQRQAQKDKQHACRHKQRAYNFPALCAHGPPSLRPLYARAAPRYTQKRPGFSSGALFYPFVSGFRKLTSSPSGRSPPSPRKPTASQQPHKRRPARWPAGHHADGS